MRPPAVLLALLIAMILAAPGRADDTPTVERATFQIRVHGHVVGAETMNVRDDGDSLSITSNTVQLLGAGGADSLIKNVGFGVDAYDLNLRSYASIQRFRGHLISQTFSIHDTLFTSYRDRDGRGFAETYVRPPGHLFIIDAGSFASFDVVCRMLRGRAFDRRSVNLFVVAGDSDTLVAAPLVDLGTEPFRWGTRSVTARRFTLGEDPGAYRIWMSSEGRLLRLEQLPSGLRVDRVAPPVKHRRPPPPK